MSRGAQSFLCGCVGAIATSIVLAVGGGATESGKVYGFAIAAAVCGLFAGATGRRG